MLDRREIYDYLECVLVDSWYEPPISFHGLAVSFRSAPHHSSAVYVKRNILYNTFMPHRLLNRQTFDSWALDFLLFGNAYLELRKNRLGQPYPFPTGQVFHLIEPDINQELYGLPEYLAAHRVPPPMMGIIPQNTGGFGDVEKAAKVFVRNELLPLNDWLGTVNPYSCLP
ncbi:hypothetical protein WDV76_09105 [Xenorhabdus griffiniae]|uniref:hypothetical protein n=1 Tax=Xenorhabdus griffiniae TaxID=351672 RepID=UPI0030D25BA3